MSNNVLQQIIDKKKLKLEKLKNEISLENINAVSYTHLTLPTTVRV